MTVYRNISNHVAVFNGVEFIPGESKDVDFFVMSPYMLEVKTAAVVEQDEDKPRRRYRKRQKQDDASADDSAPMHDEMQGETNLPDNEHHEDSDAEEISKSEESEQETSNIE